MSRGLHTFKQRDVTRAIKAAIAAGLTAYRVEIDDDGKPVVVVDGVDRHKPGTVGSWDDAIAELEKPQ